MEFEWNNTALMDLETCGERFRRKYIEKDKRPRSVPMVRGISFHTTEKRVYMRKLKEGEYPTAEEVKDLAATDFDAEWDRDEVVVDGEDVDEIGSSSVRGETKDLVIALTGYDLTTLAPGIHPVGVERKVVVKPLDSDIVIHGTMDLVHGDVDGDVIIDKKTGTKAPNKHAADSSQQFDCYGLLRLAETQRLPKAYRQDHVYRTPARKELKNVLLTTTRTLEDLQTFVQRINTAVRAVELGSFVPTSPDNWKCSLKFCEFFSDCRYTRRARPTS